MANEQGKDAVEAAVAAYDAARCAAHGRHTSPMSDMNRRSITPMIAAAVEGYLKAIAIPLDLLAYVSSHVEEIRGLASGTAEIVPIGMIEELQSAAKFSTALASAEGQGGGLMDTINWLMFVLMIGVAVLLGFVIGSGVHP